MLATLSESWQVLSSLQAEFKLYSPPIPGAYLLQPHRKQKITAKAEAINLCKLFAVSTKRTVAKRTNKDVVIVDGDMCTECMPTSRFLQSNFQQGNPGR